MKMMFWDGGQPLLPSQSISFDELGMRLSNQLSLSKGPLKFRVIQCLILAGDYWALVEAYALSIEQFFFTFIFFIFG